MTAIKEYALSLCITLIISGLLIKLAPVKENKSLLRFISLLLILTVIFKIDLRGIQDDFSFADIRKEAGEKTDEILSELSDEITDIAEKEITEKAQSAAQRFDPYSFCRLQADGKSAVLYVYTELNNEKVLSRMRKEILENVACSIEIVFSGVDNG